MLAPSKMYLTKSFTFTLPKELLHKLDFFCQKTRMRERVFFLQCWSPIELSPFGGFEGTESTVEGIAVKPVGIHIHPSFLS